MQKKPANNEVKADWHSADIKAALNKKGLTLRALSVANGCHPDTLKNALRVSYPKGERIIAAALDLNPEEIWPERYEKRNFKANIHIQAVIA